jgi:glyoxalase family protein
MRPVHGLHHVTAISGPAQENLDFYAGVLGMRLVKKSVNQDDPHLPSVLCRRQRPPWDRSHLLPWTHMAPPRQGHGLATDGALAVAEGTSATGPTG